MDDIEDLAFKVADMAVEAAVGDADKISLMAFNAADGER
jgi:hypothetical protein